MSNNFPGGLIRKTPVTPAGPLQNGAAPGMWTLAEASFWTKQGLWPIAGNFLAVEDVFSTWLYTGTGAAQTITNGINLSGQGGLVWIKSRSAATDNFLFDTTRGVNVEINSNTTDANATLANSLTAFNANGFSISSAAGVGTNAATYASWTFREAPKFFDVVTYVGDGTNNRSIAHNLGIAPGMIIVKNVTSAQSWLVYHRSTGTGNYLFLNGTDAVSTDANGFPSVSSTAFVPTANQSAFALNTSGQTFVAYLFAHDTASDGIIQCGSFTTDGSGNSPQVTLGWEPQWVMFKRTNSATFGSWQIIDTMRGWVNGSAGGADDYTLFANTSNAEGSAADRGFPTATGFNVGYAGAVSSPYIYMAIRRGPMRTPTLGTSVLSVKNYAATTTSASVTHDVTFDVELNANRDVSINKFLFVDSLRGINGVVLQTASVAVELSYPTYWSRNGQRGMSAVSGFDGWWASSSGTNNHVSYGLVRAPGFMDVVCYTGTSVSQPVNHNLNAVPEIVIGKRRNAISDWTVLYPTSSSNLNYLVLNKTDAGAGWGSNLFTTTQCNNIGYGSGETYVLYLFASVPGVSKVGTYTGNGSSQTINCAFTTGSRFVMIKRTDSTGDWYVWDSARGIVAGNDPYLALNSTAAEVTTNDSVDTDNTGFVVNQVAASNINVNAATYIFLAIA